MSPWFFGTIPRFPGDSLEIASKYHHNVAQALRTCRIIRRMFEQRIVVLNIDEFSDMSEAVPEIPESRFIVFAFKLRFVPACASLNRGFRGLVRRAWATL
jgi:hypothetical protein